MQETQSENRNHNLGTVWLSGLGYPTNSPAGLWGPLFCCSKVSTDHISVALFSPVLWQPGSSRTLSSLSSSALQSTCFLALSPVLFLLSHSAFLPDNKSKEAEDCPEKQHDGSGFCLPFPIPVHPGSLGTSACSI